MSTSGLFKDTSKVGLTHATARGLDPARARVRDAVGRELVPGPRRAVPTAPDGLRWPGRKRLRNWRHEAVAVVGLVSFLQVLGQRAPRVVRYDLGHTTIHRRKRDRERPRRVLREMATNIHHDVRFTEERRLVRRRRPTLAEERDVFQAEMRGD